MECGATSPLTMVAFKYKTCYSKTQQQIIIEAYMLNADWTQAQVI